jgi:transposase
MTGMATPAGRLSYGVLTDSEGRPVTVDVYPGNTGDPTTVPDQVIHLQTQFELTRVVLVGDRGMLTEAQLRHLRAHPGLGWISSLRSPAIRELIDRGTLQRSLFDEHHLAEITSPDYPGERLIACFNPVLADERQRKREDLLAATERTLRRLTTAAARRTTKPFDDATLGMKVGRVINHYKVAKHFTVTIGQGQLQWQRNEKAIQQEGQLDGIYVIRTSEGTDRLTTADAVRQYKSLAHVERAFRCLKGIDVRVRPIFHHTNDHVRAHIFLCMLAYYVEWHLRRVWAPLLFEDETLASDRQTRDPVLPAQPSAAVLEKKVKRETPDGLPVHSFDTLLEALAGRCEVTCRLRADPAAPPIRQWTPPTPLQARALALLSGVQYMEP